MKYVPTFYVFSHVYFKDAGKLLYDVDGTRDHQASTEDLKIQKTEERDNYYMCYPFPKYVQ